MGIDHPVPGLLTSTRTEFNMALHPCYLCKRTISDSPGRSVGTAILEDDGAIRLDFICHDCDKKGRA